jgi:hypothetical protein
MAFTYRSVEHIPQLLQFLFTVNLQIIFADKLAD